MLSFKNVTKVFGEVKALGGVSFDVEKGEFLYITGPSGSGKTTILRLILGEYVPDGGNIIFDGVNLSDLKKEDLPRLRQKIGVVFQDMKVLVERTVRENIEVGLAVIGIEKSQWYQRTNDVLKLVGLLDRSEYFPAQLSGGELQRVAIARALAVNPALILADEPTGNLDWETTEEIIKIFERINKEGKTIIMATHHKMIIENFKHRIIEIKKGEVQKDTGGKKREEKKEEIKEENKEETKEEVKEEVREEKEEDKKRIKTKVEEV